MRTYDLIIIGGGAAAFAAANSANKLKKKTLMINYSEMLPLGGTCVNVGCVPSKIMLHQGSQYYYAIKNKFRALRLDGKADFAEALRETREMVKGFQEKNYQKVIEKQKYVDFKEGMGKFIDNHTVEVAGEKFTAAHFLVATGASTFIPSVKGIGNVDYLTNKTTFIDLEKKPKSIIILGGGPEALEFSQMFHHFGIKVMIVQRSKRLLTKFDHDVAKEIQKHLENEGITIYTGTSLKEVKKNNDEIHVLFEKDGKIHQISAEKLLVATGLKPHTDDINVDKAFIALDERGHIKTNDFLQTSQKHIYAAGDVTGLMPLETVAAKQGSIAARNMFETEKRTINYNEIPQAVFTSPEVAVVGITEEEYMKRYKTCLCRTISFEHVEKALATKDTRGMIRMVLDHKTKQVIGVHMVGPMAADIITTATYAIRNKMTIDDIKDTVHIFPTLSEAIKKVAQSFYQNLDEMACCVE